MGEWKLWTITGPSFLQSRANRTLQEAPLQVSNAATDTNAVLQMRQGFDDSETITGGSLAGTTKWIGRHVANDGSEEGWVASDNSGTAVLARRTTGSFTDVTISDTATSANLVQMQSATQNGKLFLAYNSNVNRLHVWDGTTLRRVGLAQATAPTVASIGAGGLGFTRYYRQRNTVQESGITVRRSEPSSSVNITIAASSGVRVTKGAASGDGETHWEVEYADAAAGPWYRAATVVVGTTTYDDTAATVSTTTLTDSDGLYYTPPSCKYIISDGEVLLMAGAWETSSSGTQTVPFQNRVWFTRPLGSTDISDDESITTQTDLKNWIDVGDSGPITGLAGPYYGDIYVFKTNSIWKLIPTDSLTAPYRRVLVHGSLGALDQVAITTGILKGIPAIYFAHVSGVWVMSTDGFTLISDPVINYVRAANMIKPDPTTPGTDFVRLFFNDTEKMLWFVTGYPGGIMDAYFFDAQSIGWTQSLPTQFASCLALRATVLNSRLTLVGGSSTSRILTQRGSGLGYWGKDVSTGYNTIGIFRKAFAPITGHKVTIGAPTIWYRSIAGSVVTCTVALTRDSELDAIASGSFTLSAGLGSLEYDSTKQTMEGLSAADVSTLDVTITLSVSDAQTSTTAPSIDCIQIPYMVQEALPR